MKKKENYSSLTVSMAISEQCFPDNSLFAIETLGYNQCSL